MNKKKTENCSFNCSQCGCSFVIAIIVSIVTKDLEAKQ